jgi:hypothetical protein
MCQKCLGTGIDAVATEKERRRTANPPKPRSDVEIAIDQKDFAKLKTMGSAAIPALCKHIFDSNSFAKLLGEFGDKAATPSLLRLLKNGGDGGNWSSQTAAIEALVTLAEPRAVEPMLEVLLEGHFAFELGDAVCAAIEQIIHAAKGDVDSNILVKVRQLPKSVHVSYKNFDGYFEKHIDTTRAVEAAEEELRRRGAASSHAD